MSTPHFHQIRAIADRALATSADQFVVPQSHHVDVLLDLRAASPNAILRSTIDDRLSEIRFLSMIETTEAHADLEAIVALAQLDDPFDMAWAELALECDCVECRSAIDLHTSDLDPATAR
jgi:hypothetical protein